MKHCILILLCFLTSCVKIASINPGGAEISSQAKVKSSETIEVEEFNKVIVKAIEKGESWPLSPALVTFHVLGSDEAPPVYHYSQEANRTEAPDKVTSILIRDGFADDSVKGDWHRITLSKESDNTWRIMNMQRAYSCWRTNSSDYNSSPCP